jgi:predicted nucleic acid-binding protein
MILADTSVWAAHLRGNAAVTRPLEQLVDAREIYGHPWVAGEIALGSLGVLREAILAGLDKLPPAPVISPEEVRKLIDTRRLGGTGIGWTDAQLLGSALVSGADLWTLDRSLAAAAARLRAAPRMH